MWNDEQSLKLQHPTGLNATCRKPFNFWGYVIFISEGEDAQNINQSRQCCFPELAGLENTTSTEVEVNLVSLSSMAVTDEINVLFV